MFPRQLAFRPLISTLALSGCLLAGAQTLTWAGGNSGLTIFSGVERRDILNYYLDFGGHPRQYDRYKFYVPAKKLTQGASKFFISYPEHFDGKFDLDKVEVRVKGESLPLREVYWDQESRIVEIDLLESIEANTKVDLVFSNVKNPNSGTYYFVLDVQASGEIPVRLYVGTFIVSIER